MLATACNAIKEDTKNTNNRVCGILIVITKDLIMFVTTNRPSKVNKYKYLLLVVTNAFGPKMSKMVLNLKIRL